MTGFILHFTHKFSALYRMSRPSIIDTQLYILPVIYTTNCLLTLSRNLKPKQKLLFSKCAEPGACECKKASDIHYTLIQNKFCAASGLK